jgi:hypothetical protein
MRWRPDLLLVTVLLLPSLSYAQHRPSETGDVIGAVTMLADGTLEVHSREVSCRRQVVETTKKVEPSDKDYASFMGRVGGLQPLQTKPLTEWPTVPCPPPPQP